MLAYSSVENMGLIVLALGVGVWGVAAGRPVVAALGVTACLLHVWNHAAMKGLMFFAAGSVVHATGTRDMERLGGLMTRMPWTGVVMVVGAVAIAALPPLNGFTGKWLIYLGLAEWGLGPSHDRGLTPLLLIGLLALVGGLSAVSFVRLCGISLLGSPRSAPAQHAHEPSWWMRGPMVALALSCLAAALFPDRVAACFEGAGGDLGGAPQPTPGLGRRSRPWGTSTPGPWRRSGWQPLLSRCSSAGERRRADVGVRVRGADSSHAVHRPVILRTARADPPRFLRPRVPASPRRDCSVRG